MPEAALVLSPAQPHPLRELAHTLVHELGHQGVPSVVHTDGFPEPRPDRVYVWLDPRGYLEAEGSSAAPDESILRRTVFLYDEHRAPVDDAEHLELAGRGGAVFTLDAHSGRALHRRGVPARVMRPGYTPALDHFDSAAPRPVDIAFLGSHTLRRTRHLAAAAEVLSRYRTWLQIAAAPAGPSDSNSFLAEDRWSLLTSAKVLINLHCGEATDIEWRRVLDAIHAGAVVVTEHSTSISPLIPGEHLLVASAEALPFVAEALLRDPERLARMRSAAYERLSAWMPFSLPVSVLRAALVELVGEPVSPQASRGSACRRPAPANGGYAVRPAGVLAVSPVAAPRGDIVAESPAWVRARPTVSIAVTIEAADQPAMLATLESAAASARGAGGDAELVVLDDGGPVAVVAAAAEWLERHPELAWQLVCLRDSSVIPRGSARNAALSLVRAPATLIMEGGQQLHRRCIRTLADALDEAGEQTAFAYPIQKVIGNPDGFVDAGGDYLMSFCAWNTARLRDGNPVHAPALLRTQAVRELGGFATDVRLRGMEDYDLWCRMAERGWEGRLVREILACRPESPQSPVLACMHPSPGTATAALSERAPRVLAGAFDR